MKQLNFPEVEKVSKAPQMAPKISKCLQKRISKMSDLQNKFVGDLNENQKTTLVLECREISYFLQKLSNQCSSESNLRSSPGPLTRANHESKDHNEDHPKQDQVARP